SSISSIISGIPGHEIENVRITDILIEHRGGTLAQASGQLPEVEKKYPEPNMFGPTPSHGFFLRHVHGLEMNNVKIISQEPDARPAFVLEDVHGAEFVGVRSPQVTGLPVFLLRNVGDVTVHRCPPVADQEIKQANEKDL
ncbi:MAG: hypothetical protein WAM58_20900, partial [Candidatus Acidiferrum sp.]